MRVSAWGLIVEGDSFVTQRAVNDDQIAHLGFVAEGPAYIKQHDPPRTQGDQLIESTCGIRSFRRRRKNDLPTGMLKGREWVARECEVIPPHAVAILNKLQVDIGQGFIDDALHGQRRHSWNVTPIHTRAVSEPVGGLEGRS